MFIVFDALYVHSDREEYRGRYRISEWQLFDNINSTKEGLGGILLQKILQIWMNFNPNFPHNGTPDDIYFFYYKFYLRKHLQPFLNWKFIIIVFITMKH